MMDQGYIVSELDRRLTQFIRLGTIAEVDLPKAGIAPQSMFLIE